MLLKLFQAVEEADDGNDERRSISYKGEHRYRGGADWGKIEYGEFLQVKNKQQKTERKGTMNDEQ